MSVEAVSTQGRRLASSVPHRFSGHMMNIFMLLVNAAPRLVPEPACDGQVAR